MSSKNPKYEYKGLTCQRCGCLFDSKVRSKKQKYCSRSCAQPPPPKKVVKKKVVKEKREKLLHKPYFKINWETVDSMCAIQCTGEEIAGVLGCDYDTFQLACKREKKMVFTEYFNKKRSNGKMSLRRKQYSTAMDGNPTMLVWLGKNWLGQTDKIEAAVKTSQITGFEVIED